MFGILHIKNFLFTKGNFLYAICQTTSNPKSVKTSPFTGGMVLYTLAFQSRGSEINTFFDKKMNRFLTRFKKLNNFLIKFL